MKKTLQSSVGILYLALLTFGLYSCDPPKNHDKPKKNKCEPIEEKSGIHTLKTACQFEEIITKIAPTKKSLFVFDIDNTLLITNDNKFGSDWWYSQTKDDPALKLNTNDTCLFDVLTPLFYSIFDTKPVFNGQAECMDALETASNKVIGCTSRGYTRSVAASTNIELLDNSFDFMQGDTMTISKTVVMKNDVIYTKGGNKGDALLAYLKEHPYDHVYYFDDSKFKVEDVQEAFALANQPVTLYHLEIAPKIPYTDAEKVYMKEKLCNLMLTMNEVKKDIVKCNCQNP